jgi:hypothetical protein
MFGQNTKLKKRIIGKIEFLSMNENYRYTFYKLAFIIKTGHRSAGCILDYMYVYNMKILSDTTYRIVTMDKNYRTKLRFYEKGKLKKTEILKVGAGNDYLGIER